MKISSVRRLATRSLSVAAGTLLSAGLITTAFAQPAQYQRAPAQSLNFAKVDASKKTHTAKEVMMFVRLESPSVIEAVLESKKIGAVPLARAEQSAHANRLNQEQSIVRSQLEALGIKVLSNLRVGANGMRVMVRPDQVANIRALIGVRSVGPVETHTIDLGSSVGWVGAPIVWDQVGDGAGITIAVIDTGADYLHANLGGSGNPDDYANNDFNVIEPGSFPTNKVIGGYDFAGATYNANSDDPAINTPMPDPDPLDGNGHGSHVSGIAAGLGVNGSIGPGVAKGASIYALKVFGDVGGSTNLTADAIEWALDPNGDGDISDHVDVINMSLGSAFGDPNGLTAIAASNAAQMGIIVVASAGNSGNIPYVTGSPGVGSRVISVAATTTGGDVAAIEVEGEPASGRYESVEGVGATRVSDGAVTGDFVVGVPLQACTLDGNGNPVGLDNDLTNGVALIQRGGCSFDIKYVNAQISGAVAIVVYNDGANPSRVSPITMGGVGNMGIPVTIPGVMISSLAGEDLNQVITDGNSLTVTLDESLTTPTVFADSMAGFSSRGPGHGGSTFKPDMSAPGVATVSTDAGSGTGSVALSGTSMAAPHVAGAAALMRQAFPDASVSAIKAMLMNATADASPDGLIGPLHPLSRQGVGVLRVDRAANLSSFAAPAGVSFGRVNSDKRVNDKAKVSVTNTSDEDRMFKITHVAQQELDGVSISAPESIRVKAGKTKKFDIRFKYQPTATDSDDGAFSHREIDGWLMLNDGTDTLRVGYFAVVDAASKVAGRGRNGLVELKNRGPATGLAEGFTLALEGDDNEGHDSDSDSDSDDSDSDSDSDSDDTLDTAAVKALGYRTGLAAGFNIVEFGIDLEEAWETMSDVSVNLYLDVDGDGQDDVRLEATDWSDYEGNIGTMVTAQHDLVNGGMFLDWFVGIGDYNDSSAAVLFTREVDGGLVPDSFDYRLEVSSSNGSTDTESGSINLADEVIPESASLAIDPDTTVSVSTGKTEGKMLWLYQNNENGRQSQVIRVR